jgi:hypothetical protein
MEKFACLEHREGWDDLVSCSWREVLPAHLGRYSYITYRGNYGQVLDRHFDQIEQDMKVDSTRSMAVDYGFVSR